VSFSIQCLAGEIVLEKVLTTNDRPTRHAQIVIYKIQRELSRIFCRTGSMSLQPYNWARMWPISCYRFSLFWCGTSTTALTPRLSQWTCQVDNQILVWRTHRVTSFHTEVGLQQLYNLFLDGIGKVEVACCVSPFYGLWSSVNFFEL